MKVLSPAGSLETFYVALNNGADEIYMGVNSFNARAKAEKIDLEQLKKAITDAHILGTQVFCTLNTLIYESELEYVVETIKTAINLGFDAFIVQDLAVLNIIKEINPNAVIHLSTQMGVHNSFGAIMASKLGAKRIVLSREASLDDIKAIHKAVPEMEIEYFVQGALCVAFSGNCYLSNRLLGKSGNRGECAQLCRLPYYANYGEKLLENKYYLSTADLALYKHLKELKDAGVTSLKIEGRLRNSSYVGTATAFYRKRVDEIYSSEYAENKNSELRDLKISYNRGDYLLDGYLKSDFDNIIYKDFQNHIGIKIGSVVNCESFKNIYKITLNINCKLNKNDGLKIIRENSEVASLGVGNVETNGKYTIIYSGQKVKPNDEVRLIKSTEIENRVLQVRRKRKININATFKTNEKAVLTTIVNDKTIKVESDNILEMAKTIGLTKEDVVFSLSKLGDTIFELGEVNVILDNVFMPKSALNDLRRKLTSEIVNSFEVKKIYNNDSKEVINSLSNKLNITSNNNTKLKELTLISDFNALKSCDLAKIAYFPSSFINTHLDEVKAVFSGQNAKLYIFLPPFLNDSDLKSIYSKLQTFDKDKIVILANNIGELYFANEFEVVACDFCNVTNHISNLAYKNLGASGVCLGFEIADRNSTPFEYDYKINGNNILCFMSHCPYKAVTNTTCKNCKYNDALSYKSSSGVIYKVKRYRLSRCYFYLTK